MNSRHMVYGMLAGSNFVLGIANLLIGNALIGALCMLSFLAFLVFGDFDQ